MKIRYNSITTKTITLISIVLVTFVFVIVPILVKKESAKITNSTYYNIELMAKTEAAQIAGYFDLILEKSKNQSIHFQNLLSTGIVSRSSTDNYIKSTVEEDSLTIGTWAVFLEGKFDGKANEYKNTPRYGESGSYSVWYHQLVSQKPILDTLANYEDDSINQWYQSALTNKTATIVEPYKYLLDNAKEVLFISITHPILINGNVVGVTGTDANVDLVDKTISDISFFEDDYACLISEKGRYVSNPKEDLIGEHISDQISDNKVLAAIKNGKPFRSKHLSPLLNINVLDFYMPVKLMNYDEYWYLRISAPEYIITNHIKEYKTDLYIVSALGMAFVLTVVFLILYFSLRPVTKISNNFKKLATEGITKVQTINVRSNDEIGVLTKSYNQFISTITEKENADIKLIRKERNFQNLFVQSADANMLISPVDGTYIDCNTEAVKIFGVNSKEDFIGKTPKDFSPERQPSGVKSAEASLKYIKNAIIDDYSRFDFVHKKLNGEEFDCRITLSKVFYNGEEIILAGIRDVSELKKQEEKVGKSQQQLQEVFDSAPSMMLVVNKNREIQNANKAVEIETQKEPELIKGMLPGILFNCAQLHNTGERCGNTEKCNTCQLSGIVGKTFANRKGVKNLEINMKVAVGGKLTPITLLVSSSVLANSENILLTIENVTEQKRQKEHIIEVNTRLKSLFENMTTGFAEHEIILDEHGTPCDYRHVYTNPAFAKLTGMENVIGKTIKQLDPDIAKGNWISRYGEVALNGKPITFEDYSSYLKKHFRVYAFSNQKGHFAILFDDITEEIEQSEKIQEYNFFANTALALSKSGTYHIDFTKHPDRFILDEKAIKIEGLVLPDGVNYMSFEDWASNVLSTNRKDAEQKLAQMPKNLANPNSTKEEMTWQFTRPSDEKVIWLCTKSITKRDEEGNPTYIYGVVQDITESVKTQLSLEKQKEMSDVLMLISSSYINITPNQVDKAINDALEEIGGFVRADRIYVYDYNFDKNTCDNTYEWCAHGVGSVMHEMHDFPLNSISQVVDLHKKGQPWTIEDIRKFENGEVRELLISQGINSVLTIPMYINNSLSGFLGIDITTGYREFTQWEIALLNVFVEIVAKIQERSLNEKELQHSRQNLAEAQQIAHMGNWEVNFATNQTFWSDEIFRIHGLKPGEIEVSLDSIMEFVNPAEVAKVRERIYTTRDTGQPLNCDHGIMLANGKVRHIQVRGVAVKDNKGVVVGMKGTTQDITEQKGIENELARINKLADNALSLTKSGFWYIDYKTPEYYYPSDKILEMLGEAQKESALYHITDEWYSRLLEADKYLAEKALKGYLDAAQGLCEFDVVYKYKRPLDGKIIWLRSIGELVKDENGNNLFMYGVKQDITEQKLAEQEKERTIHRQRIIQETAQIGSWQIEFTSGNPVINMDPSVIKIQGEISKEGPNPTQLDAWALNIIKNNPENGKKIVDKTFADLYNPSVTEWNSELKYKRPIDDKIIWLKSKAHILRNNEGTPIHVSGVTQDVTQYRLAHERLLKEKNFSDRLTKYTPMAVYVHDWVNMRTGYINERYTEILGFSQQELNELYPKKFIHNFHPDDAERVKAHTRIVRSEKQTHSMEYRAKHKDGHYIWCLAYDSPFEFNEQGEVISMIGAFLDITDQKTIEKELTKAKEAAETANVAKSAFLANMSHEIRTPMNSIIGFSEILEKRIVDPVNRDFLDSIRISGKNLLGLINDVLDFSKIEAGRFELNPVPTDLKTTINEISHIFKVRAQEKCLVYKTIVPDNLPQFINLDELRLKQVLINLIGNALKFTSQGEVCVALSCKKKDDKKVDITIKVTDTGIGIPAEEYKKIFEAFKQQDQQDNRKFGGTGLGLSISNSLISLMGSKIEVQSKLQKGSEFYFTLENVEISSSGNFDHKPKMDVRGIDFGGAKILVVDDIENNLKVVSGLLADKNLQILKAGSGKLGIDLVKTEKPDLILLDIQMPDMDGYQVLDVIKSLDSNIKLVALTASASKEEIEKSKKHGFDRFLVKPIEEDVLLACLIDFLPHQLIEKDAPSAKRSIELFSAENILNNKILFAAVKKECLPLFIKYKTLKSTRVIKQLAESILNTGEIQSSEDLINIGNGLLMSVESFNIDKMDDIINELETLFMAIDKELTH